MKSLGLLEIQDPWLGVKQWFLESQKCNLNNYNAVTLSTSDGENKVSSSKSSSFKIVYYLKAKVKKTATYFYKKISSFIV